MQVGIRIIYKTETKVNLLQYKQTNKRKSNKTSTGLKTKVQPFLEQAFYN